MDWEKTEKSLGAMRYKGECIILCCFHEDWNQAKELETRDWCYKGEWENLIKLRFKKERGNRVNKGGNFGKDEA